MILLHCFFPPKLFFKRENAELAPAMSCHDVWFWLPTDSATSTFVPKNTLLTVSQL